ncbi:MAG TPA: malto-oligosyltrehalose synthase [Actinomycetota bacterium]|nr:malto-oligosyltrehalose synthase [Actinomycetota bacterium]
MVPIRATYRVQLSGRFPFAAARGIVPYLADLGVSHLYASPVLRARSGSAHGYDVVDPTQVSPELGGEAGLRELVDALRAHGMGLVVDIVPNHMAASHENPWWVETLRHGPASPFARVFDVDWAAGGGRVRLPVLAGPEGRVAGDLRIDGGWVRYHQHRFPLAPGTDRLDQQHYELVEWRRAAVDGNYRRFFTVNDLVGVRQEDPEVFRMTHATTLRLVADGLVDGVRVDHVDGLADPAAYLERLDLALRSLPGGARGQESGDGVPWLVVEKILEPGERLPAWPVAGTTGYEFLAVADGVLVDPAAAGTFAERYRRLTGTDPDPAELAVACKREWLLRDFHAEVAGVAGQLPGDPAANRDAVVELAAQLPVYRTYVTDRVSDADRAVVVTAAAAAARRLDPAGRQALARMAAALLLASPAPAAVRRFQQLSGPAMAKGVEDTALYRDTRLLARNEVGGDLGRFGRHVAELHAANAEREARWPASMLATSTHDSKRGEDVRARLAVLSEHPQRWWVLAERWTGRLAGPGGVDPADALLLWQTMAGAWPLEQERCLAYMEKAVREAGRRTTWTDPDPAYERAVRELVERAYADPRLRDELEELVAEIGPAGRVKAAGLALLRLTSPGVPDTYQGTETEQLVLVDPDNRRPVAFEADGSLKFRVTRAALRLRRQRPELFAGYRPLAAPDHLVAFARGGDRLVVVVTRLTGGSPDPSRSTGAVDLPPGPWHDLLSGSESPGGLTPAGELLAAHPHALLAFAGTMVGRG